MLSLMFLANISLSIWRREGFEGKTLDVRELNAEPYCPLLA